MGGYDPVPHYGAYVLRFWETRSQSPEAAPVWRFSLEAIHTRERRGFPDLESLVTFLQSLTRGTSVVFGDGATAIGLEGALAGACGASEKLIS